MEYQVEAIKYLQIDNCPSEFGGCDIYLRFDLKDTNSVRHNLVYSLAKFGFKSKIDTKQFIQFANFGYEQVLANEVVFLQNIYSYGLPIFMLSNGDRFDITGEPIGYKEGLNYYYRLHCFEHSLTARLFQTILTSFCWLTYQYSQPTTEQNLEDCVELNIEKCLLNSIL